MCEISIKRGCHRNVCEVSIERGCHNAMASFIKGHNDAICRACKLLQHFLSVLIEINNKKTKQKQSNNTLVNRLFSYDEIIRVQIPVIIMASPFRKK